MLAAMLAHQRYWRCKKPSATGPARDSTLGLGHPITCRCLPRTCPRSSSSRSRSRAAQSCTIGEAANYVLALDPEQADVAAVSHQVHLALFYDAQLDIRAMD